MKFKFSHIIQNLNNLLHFSNIGIVSYGIYNQKYFSDKKRKVNNNQIILF